jgi:hypothetical protein
MDKFECKAPMYVNFVQSSSLDDNDGADKFFGNYDKATYKLNNEIVHAFNCIYHVHNFVFFVRFHIELDRYVNMDRPHRHYEGGCTRQNNTLHS